MIPLSYQIVRKIILLNTDRNIRISFLQEICKKATESVTGIVRNYKDRMSTANGNLISLWVAILMLNIVFEFKPEIFHIYQVLNPLFDLIKIFIDYLIKKPNRDEKESNSYEYNEDVINKYFRCKNIDPYPESSLTPRNYYKGY